MPTDLSDVLAMLMENRQTIDAIADTLGSRRVPDLRLVSSLEAPEQSISPNDVRAMLRVVPNRP